MPEFDSGDLGSIPCIPAMKGLTMITNDSRNTVKQPAKKWKSIELEVAIAEYYGIRTNLVVPNISWGMGMHECDLLIMTKAGYCTEVEIKVSKSDLIADLSKKHGHKHKNIKALFFAVPDTLEEVALEHVPKHAGIYVVMQLKSGKYRVKVLRGPECNAKAKALTLTEQYNMARLGSMRIWGLKQKIINLTKSNNSTPN